MEGDWRPEPWVLLRVAALPVDVLRGLQLARTTALHERLVQAEQHLEGLGRACVQLLFDAIKHCDDDPQRHLLLTLKRKIYGGKPISPMLARGTGVLALPCLIQRALANIATAEAEVSALTVEYGAMFAKERLAIAGVLRDRIVGSDWSGEILLSSGDLWRAIQWGAEDASHRPASARQLREQSALARYLFRSATRTAPFGGFAAAALVQIPVNEAKAPDALRSPQLDPLSPDERWEDIAQVHSGALQRWLRHNLADEAIANLPMRVAPLKKMVHTDSATLVTFPVFNQAVNGIIVRTVQLGALTQQVMSRAHGGSTNEVCDSLSASDDERGTWRQLVDSMIEIGLLVRELPSGAVDQAGLLALARELGQLGDSLLAQQVFELAELVRDYPRSDAPRRAAYIAKLKDLMGLTSREVPLYVDKAVNGVRAADLGVSSHELTDVLRPALMLARASVCDEPHQLLCDAFVERFGGTGNCDDVPAFLTELIQDHRLTTKIRRSVAPVSWLNSSLGRAIAEAEGTRASLDVDLFEQLDARAGRFAFAAFVQLIAPINRGLQTGDYQLVLNGIQSGRHKYISRYLSRRHPMGDLALKTIRDQFRAADDPLPVELMPGMGLNFQIHPQLTPWAFELPGGLNAEPDATISLSDLSLRFDATRNELRVRSARLGRDIEPVHLGFLRDLNLPDELLLIRALSPRIAEEAVAERADVYNLIDRWDAIHTNAIRRYGPRLEVGKLVLARARWAVPLAEMPLQKAKESEAACFRRLTS